MDASLSLQHTWIEQWRSAGPALAEQRRIELQEMSDQAALAASENLLSLVTSFPLDDSRRRWSGLVEQQALFHRRPLA